MLATSTTKPSIHLRVTRRWLTHLGLEPVLDLGLSDGDGLTDGADPRCWLLSPPEVQRCADAASSGGSPLSARRRSRSSSRAALPTIS